MMTNAINWFEIPVTDFDRAKRFYNALYDYEMPEMFMGPTRMGFFPYSQSEGVGGAICQGDDHHPTDKGAKIYLNGGEDLNLMLNRVEAAGGKVVLPKTLITEELGYFGVFSDTEGNQISIHSMH